MLGIAAKAWPMHFVAKERATFPNFGGARDPLRGATSERLQYSGRRSRHFGNPTRRSQNMLAKTLDRKAQSTRLCSSSRTSINHIQKHTRTAIIFSCDTSIYLYTINHRDITCSCDMNGQGMRLNIIINFNNLSGETYSVSSRDK